MRCHFINLPRNLTLKNEITRRNSKGEEQGIMHNDGMTKIMTMTNGVESDNILLLNQISPRLYVAPRNLPLFGDHTTAA